MLNDGISSDCRPIGVVDKVRTLRLGWSPAGVRIALIDHSLSDINHSSWSKLARALLQVGKAFHMILLYDQVGHFLRLYSPTVPRANDRVMSNRHLVSCIDKNAPALFGRRIC